MQLQPTEDYFDNIVKTYAFTMKKYYEKIKMPVSNKEYERFGVSSLFLTIITLMFIAFLPKCSRLCSLYISFLFRVRQQIHRQPCYIYM